MPHAPRKIAAPQVATFRLRRHHLVAPAEIDPVFICRDICGAQAQIMPAARLSIGARTRGVSPAQIEAALWQKRTLVKALCMRQTVHLLPAAEFGLYMAAVRRSRVAAVERVMARFDITAKDTDALNRATLDALETGPLPHKEIARHVRPRVSSRVRAWMDRVWNPARLALVQGLLCYGPDRGSQVTFVRADQWLPRQPPVAELDAQQIILRGFLRAYGPATLRDFSHWSGIPVREARVPWGRVAGDLTDVVVDGQTLWLLREDAAALQDSRLRGPLVNLLPAFDAFLLAHAEKNHLVEPRHYKKVYRGVGQISPVVLVDGRIAGTWRHRPRGKNGWEVSVQLFAKPTGPMRDAVAAQAERHAGFLGLRAVLAFGPP